MNITNVDLSVVMRKNPKSDLLGCISDFCFLASICHGKFATMRDGLTRLLLFFLNVENSFITNLIVATSVTLNLSSNTLTGN